MGTDVARGELSGAFMPGLDLDVLLDAEVLKLDGKVIDADVRVGRGSREVRCRLVGVPTEKGYCFFLSSLPPRIAARSVADLYRVRWEIDIYRFMVLSSSQYSHARASGIVVCACHPSLGAARKAWSFARSWASARRTHGRIGSSSSRRPWIHPRRSQLYSVTVGIVQLCCQRRKQPFCGGATWAALRPSVRDAQ